MKIVRLKVTNFKGITHVDLTDLKETVVIAGQNGCGKSSIFDAIRLWKTIYGGYIANEINNWYAENGITIGANSLSKALQDKTKPLEILAELALSELEKVWLSENAESVLRAAAYRRRVPDYAFEWKSFAEAELDDRLRPHTESVNRETKALLPNFVGELGQEKIVGEFKYDPAGTSSLRQSTLLNHLFSIYDPTHIGKFDYHGPQRFYNRENVEGVNLQFEQFESQRQHHALYNYSNKYSNVKSELASAYVRDLISREYSRENKIPAEGESLVSTMQEMFIKFFPGKKFLGVAPKANGTLSFDVETAAGKHDLGDLSSGEKELIYGYLRLKNESPKNSIIMLDEPELHLNPRLTDGLPDFYHRHIGQALGNQLWLVTHSDSILRQAVGHEDFSVYHMQSAGFYEGSEQAVELNADTELKRALYDLVGDLAAYAPNAKTVFLEGGGTSKFDESIIIDLFPTVAKRMNIISSGNKSRVRLVHNLLEAAKNAGTTTSQFFSITDRDGEDLLEELPGTAFTWDRYHIENYLLESSIIRSVMLDLRVVGAKALSDNDVHLMLKESAESTLSRLVQHHMENEVHRSMRSAIKVNTSREAEFNAREVFEAASSSVSRLASLLTTDLSAAEIQRKSNEIKALREESLRSGDWIKEFRGREILKAFCASHLKVDYETFRNLIISKMRSEAFEPSGIKDVLSKIDPDAFGVETKAEEAPIFSGV